MFYPSFEEVQDLAKTYNRIPIYKEMDISEPGMLLILKTMQENHDMIFLESAKEDKEASRFSYIGFNPRKVYHFCPPHIIAYENGRETVAGNNFFDFVKDIISRYASPVYRQFGGFNGGLAGYIGFETVNYCDILRKQLKETDRLPHSVLLYIDDFICHDNREDKFYLSTSCYIDDATSLEKKYTEALIQLEELENDIIRKISETVIPHIRSFSQDFELQFRESYESFTGKVEKIKQLINDGEAIQVVLSMRADIPGSTDPYKFYLKLRKLNPSPYMFFFKSGDITVTGSSPEIHVKISGSKVYLKPIAGTIAQAKDKNENERNKQILLNDPKERAEHLMLVDLARNDLARIAKPGTVNVLRFMEPEDFSHVIHLISLVEAELSPQKHASDVLKETFPAGTLSGAPKVRALEIIDECETHARDIYGGAVGYIGFNGETDTCITIRTAYFTPEGNYIQAGAGIVQDSVPDKEYKEICNKLKALSVSLPFAKI